MAKYSHSPFNGRTLDNVLMEDGPLITGPVRSQKKSHRDLTYQKVDKSQNHLVTMRTSDFIKKHTDTIGDEYELLEELFGKSKSV